MELKIIKDYKRNDKYRKSFNELAKLTFNIDFEKWYQLGFWDNRHICFSYVDGERVIANVSASKMDIIQKGKSFSAVQIGTVMTHPEYQRRGLADKLMKEVFNEYRNKCNLMFLFANKSALGFYNRYGFSTVTETQFTAKINVEGKKGLEVRKLDLSDTKDIGILNSISKERITLSEKFGVDNSECILAWHCISVFPKDIYYIDSLDTIVIYKIKDNIIDIFDVVSCKKVNLLNVINEIATKEINKVVFHFTPDIKDLPIERTPYKTNNYVFFVKSDSIKLNGEFFFPYTAHA